MKISILKQPPPERIECLVIPVFMKDDCLEIRDMYPDIFLLIKKREFKGEIGESIVFFDGNRNRICLIQGMGDHRNLFHARKGARHLVPALIKQKVSIATVHFVQRVDLSEIYLVNFLDYLFLNNYRFDRYISKKKNLLKEIKIIFNETFSIKDKMIRQRKKIGEGVNWARDLVNDIPATVTPSSLVESAYQMEKNFGIQTEVFRTTELKARKLNGILSVGQSSPHEPALIQCLYEPAEPVATIAVVGKGITFDSGGLNIKTGNYMRDMKQDMAGAAVVLGLMRLVSSLQIPIKVYGFSAVAENMPGQSAYKPGDVITFNNGKTVEVVNTDAEGRLALADALIIAAEKKPSCLIEISTLTGTMHSALGDMFAGLFGSSKRLNKQLVESGDRTGDLLCEFPMIEDYKESIRSKIADIKNADYRGASAIKAGLFLKEFTKKVPFVHIDIASAGFLSQPNSFFSMEGSTGFGIRLILDFFFRICARRA